MTRKFNPENFNFLGTCFSLVSLSEQFSKNFCSVNSSLLLKQHSFNYSLKLIKLKQVVELTLISFHLRPFTMYCLPGNTKHPKPKYRINNTLIPH